MEYAIDIEYVIWNITNRYPTISHLYYQGNKFLICQLSLKLQTCHDLTVLKFFMVPQPCTEKPKYTKFSVSADEGFCLFYSPGFPHFCAVRLRDSKKMDLMMESPIVTIHSEKLYFYVFCKNRCYKILFSSISNALSRHRGHSKECNDGAELDGNTEYTEYKSTPHTEYKEYKGTSSSTEYKSVPYSSIIIFPDLIGIYKQLKYTIYLCRNKVFRSHVNTPDNLKIISRCITHHEIINNHYLVIYEHDGAIVFNRKNKTVTHNSKCEQVDVRNKKVYVMDENVIKGPDLCVYLDYLRDPTHQKRVSRNFRFETFRLCNIGESGLGTNGKKSQIHSEKTNLSSMRSEKDSLSHLALLQIVPPKEKRSLLPKHGESPDNSRASSSCTKNREFIPKSFKNLEGSILLFDGEEVRIYEKNLDYYEIVHSHVLMYYVLSDGRILLLLSDGNYTFYPKVNIKDRKIEVVEDSVVYVEREDEFDESNDSYQDFP